MSWRKILFFMALPTIVITAIVIFQAKHHSIEMQTIQESFRAQNQEINNIMKRNLFLLGLPEHISLKNGTFRNWFNEEIHIDSIKKKLPLTVFRLTTNGCNKCINPQIEFINNCSRSMRDELMIMASFGSDNEKKLYLKDKSYECYFLDFVDNENVLSRLDALFYPYYFILNEDLNISNIFFPLDKADKYTVEYLNLMKYNEASL